MIKIVYNGHCHAVTATSTVSCVIEQFPPGSDVFAVMHNDCFVPRAQYTQVKLQEGDRLDIVEPMPGG